jgi:antitoxin (DNA-binding transcriptional repressor) of toxin-antitoxin stability system
VSEKEFKTGVARYLDLVSEEEIVITKDGKHVAKLTAAADTPEAKAAIIRSLRGILPDTATLEEAHEERIKKHEAHL